MILPLFNKGKGTRKRSSARPLSFNPTGDSAKNFLLIVSMLRANGFDDYSIAGIMANSMVETGGTFNPAIHTNGTSYFGLWLNNRDLMNRIISLYGGHSLDNQTQYVIDWANNDPKLKDHRLNYLGGRYKKTGYRNAQDAALDFLKLYERAIIKDKNGKIIGYQGQDKRLGYAPLIYDYIRSGNQTPMNDQVVQQELPTTQQVPPMLILQPVIQQPAVLQPLPELSPNVGYKDTTVPIGKSYWNSIPTIIPSYGDSLYQQYVKPFIIPNIK